MSSQEFTDKLANLYKKSLPINEEEAKLEEGILSQINSLFGSTGADPEVYKAAVENIIRIKLDDMKLLKDLAANLVKLDAAISKIPSLAKTPEAKRAVESNLQAQRDTIKKRIESLQTDIETIKTETKQIAKTIDDAVSVKNKDTAPEEEPAMVESFKKWIN
jgi:hypothetical protein